MTAQPTPASELPDANAQCIELAALIRPRLRPDTVLVGIHSGGVWVADNENMVSVYHAQRIDAGIGHQF